MRGTLNQAPARLFVVIPGSCRYDGLFYSKALISRNALNCAHNVDKCHVMSERKPPVYNIGVSVCLCLIFKLGFGLLCKSPWGFFFFSSQEDILMSFIVCICCHKWWLSLGGGRVDTWWHLSKCLHLIECNPGNVLYRFKGVLYLPNRVLGQMAGRPSYFAFNLYREYRLW